MFWIKDFLFRFVKEKLGGFCRIPCDKKSLAELQFKAEPALQRCLSQGFQSVLPEEEFLILLNIHIINWGEPSFPSISMASTCRTWKMIWVEFISALPEKWLHNPFLGGQCLTLMTLLVILPLIPPLSPLFCPFLGSTTAPFLPCSVSLCKGQAFYDDWELPRQSWVTFLKSVGCFLEINCIKGKLLTPNTVKNCCMWDWVRSCSCSPELGVRVI